MCDESARLLTNEQRSAVAEFFSVFKQGESSQKAGRPGGPASRALPDCSFSIPCVQVKLSFPLHPSLQRAHDQALRAVWVDVRRPTGRTKWRRECSHTRPQSILPMQGLLERADRLPGVLAMIPDEELRASLSERFKASGLSTVFCFVLRVSWLTSRGSPARQAGRAAGRERGRRALARGGARG